jgi:hypothetical protein
MRDQKRGRAIAPLTLTLSPAHGGEGISEGVRMKGDANVVDASSGTTRDNRNNPAIALSELSPTSFVGEGVGEGPAMRGRFGRADI